MTFSYLEKNRPMMEVSDYYLISWLEWCSCGDGIGSN
jgi:hypothetical protein